MRIDRWIILPNGATIRISRWAQLMYRLKLRRTIKIDPPLYQHWGKHSLKEPK